MFVNVYLDEEDLLFLTHLFDEKCAEQVKRNPNTHTQKKEFKRSLSLCRN